MGSAVRVSGVGRALGLGAALAAGWVVGVCSLPVAAWAKAALVLYPVVAPVVAASTVRVTTDEDDSLIELTDPDEDDE